MCRTQAFRVWVLGLASVGGWVSGCQEVWRIAGPVLRFYATGCMEEGLVGLEVVRLGQVEGVLSFRGWRKRERERACGWGTGREWQHLFELVALVRCNMI